MEEHNHNHDGHTNHEGHTHEGHTHEGHTHEGHTNHDGANHGTHQGNHQNGLAGMMSEAAYKFPKLTFKNFDFSTGFKKFLEIIKLNKTVISEVAADEKYNDIAALFLVLGSVVPAFAFYIFGVKILNVTVRPDLGLTLVEAVTELVMAVVGLYAITIVANKLFKANGTFQQFFRVAGMASFLNVILVAGFIIPGLFFVLGLASTIWLAVVGFTVLCATFKLDTTNAFLAILVAVICLYVLGRLVSGISGGRIGMMGGGGYSSNVNITY